MSDSIPLHPEYGVNPTISTCFYCGEGKNEIALLGSHYNGEAPMHMVLDVVPCDACKEKYADYTLIVEMARVVDRRGTAYNATTYKDAPSGRWCVVPKSSLNMEKSTPVAYMAEGDFIELVRKIESDSLAES